MSNKRHHAEWLSLLEISGPFVSLPILEKVFPQGLDAHDPDHARRMRLAFDEWETNQSGPKPSPAIHNAWIEFVLKETLTLPDEVLASGQSIPQTLKATHSEAGEFIRPDFVILNPSGIPDAGTPRIVVQVYPAAQHLEKHVYGHRWKASPADRMAELLKQTKCQLGLVTNGDRWMLVNKTDELPTGFASWYAWLWIDHSSDTFAYLRSFRSLLSTNRFFGALPGQTLEEMLVESSTHQQEVTDQLGLQVRRAVEVLIQSLDRADQDDKVLAGVPETVLYEAALTVMMRLVFLFCAEERELLLLGDPLYDQHYAVSTLVAQLEESADKFTEDVLERRLDAWSRLLSTFRAVFGGVQHERMKLPAYAGNLFDPDRFPFLEGRKSKTTWKDTPASPLPVNNRTVLHLLRSLQYLQIHGEAQRVSFRALGIEQIGHVYEGLLDHTAKRATEPVLGLAGGKGKEPEIALFELEKRRAKSEDELVKFLKEETGRSESAITNALGVELEGVEAGKLRAACGNDNSLYERVVPFAGLIHNDSFDRPVVIRKGSVYVTAGTDRRTSGTHYTPTSLTEPIVQHTLEPLCYVGPAEGNQKNQWQLRSAKELLDLKICDMACGSGAFLVQACRFLSELLVEAWETHEAEVQPGKQAKLFDQSLQNPLPIIRMTPYGEPSKGGLFEQIVPLDTEERLVYARRLVAQRCLYGVDKNPLAVEMAKLSLWLLTLAKDKPFTFLDHCIRSGDSLVGISSIDQLLRFSLSGDEEIRPAFKKELRQIENRLNAVKLLRRQIEEQPSNTPQDIDRKAAMLKNADEQTRRLTYAADLLLAASWQPMTAAERESSLNAMLIEVEYKFKDLPVEQLDEEATKRLQKASVDGRFHWPLEFPEAFERGGFDAFVGNPPFLGGSRISGTFGDNYLGFLLQSHLSSNGNADICSFFIRRAISAMNQNGCCGFVTTNSIAKGETRTSGLQYLIDTGHRIIRAVRSQPWPGTANVFISTVHVFKGAWTGDGILDGERVAGISSFLDTHAAPFVPMRLATNLNTVFRGPTVGGEGFILTPDERKMLISLDPKSEKIIRPFLTGQDINQHPQQVSDRFAIDFGDMEEKEATQFDACWKHLYSTVRLQRVGNKIPQRERFWWRYIGRQEKLYEAIQGFSRALVCGEVSKYWGVSWVSPHQVFAGKVVVFALEGDGGYALLNSCFHTEWAEKTSSRLKGDPAYSLADTFETFPMPMSMASATKEGECYDVYRAKLMLDTRKGFTSTYNRFHDSDDKSADIQRLRDLHVELDQAVAAAYQWNDLNLGHGFHKSKQGERFTISETARREVLQRLLKLNHERYAEEVKQGLHDKKGKAKKMNTGKGRNKDVATSPSLPGFGNDDEDG